MTNESEEEDRPDVEQDAPEGAPAAAEAEAEKTPEEEPSPSRATLEESTEAFEEAQAIDVEPHDRTDVRAIAPWRSEEAANFLVKAIHEAQKPLTAAVSRPSVPTTTVALMVAVLAIFIVGLGYQLFKLNDAHMTQAVRSRAEREILYREHQIELAIERSRSDGLSRRLDAQQALLVKSRLETAEAIQEALRQRELSERSKAANEKSNAEAASFNTQLNKAMDKIGVLSHELEAQEAARERLMSTQAAAQKASAEAKKQLAIAHALQQQIDAQSQETAALKKQLEIARALLRTIQENPGTGEGIIKDMAEATVLDITPKKDDAKATPPPAKKDDDAKIDM